MHSGIHTDCTGVRQKILAIAAVAELARIRAVKTI
jgi:hypothetical protein